MTIADDTGRQVRRFEVPKTVGLNRATWNLRGDPPQAEGRGGADGRGAGGGGRGGDAGDPAGGGEQPQAAQGFGGRGGAPQGPLVSPGRYRATLGRHSGDSVTPIGAAAELSGRGAADTVINPVRLRRAVE